MHGAQVPQETVRAQDPAHLDQEHRAGGKALWGLANPLLDPQAGLSYQGAYREGPPPPPPALTHLPARGTKGLASAANSQGAFPHAGEAGCPRPKRVAAEMGAGAGEGWELGPSRH